MIEYIIILALITVFFLALSGNEQIGIMMYGLLAVCTTALGGEGDDCHFRMCFLSPNDYHITLHETLLGAYDTFSGMKRVTVGP